MCKRRDGCANAVHYFARHIVVEKRNGAFVIKNIEIRGTDSKQLEIRVDFAGSKKGKFILYGTPVLDVVKQTISIPDINYGIETRDIVLNIGEKLFRNRIINSLKEKAFIDLPSLIAKTRPQLESQLNRRVNTNFSTRGKLHDVKVTGLAAGKSVLHMQTYIRANIELIGAGF